MGRQNLHAAIAVLAVGVHHAAGDFYQLADVAHQQRTTEAKLPADIQGLPNKVGGLHRLFGVHGQSRPDKVAAVVAGGQQDVFVPVCPALL